MSFRSSLACLEPTVFAQMNFVGSVIDEGQSVISKWLGSNSSETSSSDSPTSKCGDTEGFSKLKYYSTNSVSKTYLDDYEKGVIPNKILLEVVLQMDPFKIESLRSST